MKNMKISDEEFSVGERLESQTSEDTKQSEGL